MIPFQFDPRAEKVEYFLIYNANDLLADIGGYLGLFLGLSCFGIVELFGKLFSSSPADVNRSEKKIKEDPCVHSSLRREGRGKSLHV